MLTSDPNATSLNEIMSAFVCLIRDSLFKGEELALVEPVNGPRPNTPYCTLSWESCLPLAHQVKNYGWRDKVFHEQQSGSSYCRLAICFFGQGATVKAEQAQKILSSSNRLFDLTRIIGLGKIGEITSRCEEVQGQVEEQAEFSLEFHAALSAESPFIDIAKVKGVIDQNAESHVPFSIPEED